MNYGKHHPVGRGGSQGGRLNRRRTLLLLSFGCVLMVLLFLFVHMGGSQGAHLASEARPHGVDGTIVRVALIPETRAATAGGADGGDDVDAATVPTPTTASSMSDAAAMDILRAYDNAVVDRLLRCGDDAPVAAKETVANSSSAADAAALSRRLNKKRFDRCYHAPGAKFMYFGNNWGRHFNQVTSLVAALTLSAVLHRTLIVPPFVFEGRRIHVYHMYDARRLFDVDVEGSPYCVLTEDEFYELEIGQQADGGAQHRRPAEVDAACVTMRGITKHPQLPAGFKFRCVASPFIKFKKNLKLFFDVVGASDARLLTLPLVIYYAQALPEAIVLCPWRRLRPHPVLANAVHMLMARQLIPANHHDASMDVAVRTSIGVHLRSLEGSCKSRQKQYANPTVAAAMELQCTMLPEYILDVARRALRQHHGERGGVLNSDGELIKDEVMVIIADDGQQPQRAQELARTLPNAVRVQDVLASNSMVSSVKVYLDDLKRAPAPTPNVVMAGPTSGIEPPYDLSNYFYVVPGALALQLDFWALATTTVFVGNQVSTLSMNVCRYRRATGRRCDNFV